MRRTTGGLAVAAMVFLAMPGDTPAQDALTGACAEVQAGTPPVCTKLHPTGTPLRLPADGAAIYGAVGRGTKFVTASGRRLAMTDEVMTQIEGGYPTTIYRATVAEDQVTGLEPVLLVRSDAIMERMFGSRVFIGRISVRTSRRGAPYASRPTLPVVVQITSRARGRGIRGTILNSHRDVRVGKQCAPALSRHPRDPLVKGFTRRVTVERHPSMHLPFQDTLVFAWSRNSSGMGPELYPSLATLFGRDAMGKRWEIQQHGAPFGGPSLTLRLARRGARPRRC